MPDEGETTLGRVAKVRSGYAFRKGVTDDPDGDVRVLQLSDIDREGRFEPEALACMAFGIRAERHALEPDDVLLTARGERIVALRALGTDHPIVAAAGLLVISPTSRLDSGYLYWYLDHPRARHRLARLREGSNLRFLERRAVECLPIPVPTLAVQREIAARHLEHGRRRALRDALSALDGRIMNETTWQRARRSVAPDTGSSDTDT